MEMRPTGRIFSSCIQDGLSRALVECRKGETALSFMHVRRSLRQERAHMDMAARGKQESFGGEEGEAG